MELLKHMQPAKSSGVGAIGVAKDCVSITYRGGSEVAMGDAKVCPGSWLDAESTDLTAAWSSRTRASRCFLLPRSHGRGCSSFQLFVEHEGGPQAPDSVLALVQSSLVLGYVVPLASLWTMHEAWCFLGQFMGGSHCEPCWSLIAITCTFLTSKGKDYCEGST